MPNTQTVRVPHLGGIDAAYQMPHAYDSEKPTLVLVNSFTTSSELFRDQFNDRELNKKVNLLAIELLGHGQTRTSQEHWTYWDTAQMNLQVLDALGIDRVFVQGTSQGGWVTAQMALLQPDKVVGIIPMGTSMDSESERSRQLGCWDGPTIVSSFVSQWTSSEFAADFEPDDVYCDALINVGFNECLTEDRDFWRSTIKSNYGGDDGRRRLRMAGINLAERGGLRLRLSDIRCPGSKDAVYSVSQAAEDIKKFTQSPDAQLVTVDGGAHFLNWTHPVEVNKAILNFVSKY